MLAVKWEFEGDALELAAISAAEGAGPGRGDRFRTTARNTAIRARFQGTILELRPAP